MLDYAKKIKKGKISLEEVLNFLEESSSKTLKQYAIDIRKGLMQWLMKKDAKGYNPLWQAAMKSPQDFKQMLMAINALNIYQKIVILRQPSGHFNAILVKTVCDHYEQIDEIIDAINTQEQKGRFMLLGNQEKQLMGMNVLMYAVSYRPECIQPLLNSIGTLEIPQQLVILDEEDTSEKNVLVIAAIHRPECIPLLLQAMRSLHPANRVDILIWTLLRVISSGSMVALKRLLDIIIPELESDEKVLVLSNTLLTAIDTHVHFESMALLINAISKLEPQERIFILNSTTDNGETALTLASLYAPSIVEPLLEAMNTSTLSYPQQTFFQPLPSTQGKPAPAFPADTENDRAWLKFLQQITGIGWKIVPGPQDEAVFQSRTFSCVLQDDVKNGLNRIDGLLDITQTLSGSSGDSVCSIEKAELLLLAHRTKPSL